MYLKNILTFLLDECFEAAKHPKMQNYIVRTFVIFPPLFPTKLCLGLEN